MSLVAHISRPRFAASEWSYMVFSRRQLPHLERQLRIWEDTFTPRELNVILTLQQPQNIALQKELLLPFKRLRRIARESMILGAEPGLTREIEAAMTSNVHWNLALSYDYLANAVYRKTQEDRVCNTGYRPGYRYFAASLGRQMRSDNLRYMDEPALQGVMVRLFSMAVLEGLLMDINDICGLHEFLYRGGMDPWIEGRWRKVLLGLQYEPSEDHTWRIILDAVNAYDGDAEHFGMLWLSDELGLVLKNTPEHVLDHERVFFHYVRGIFYLMQYDGDASEAIDEFARATREGPDTRARQKAFQALQVVQDFSAETTSAQDDMFEKALDFLMASLPRHAPETFAEVSIAVNAPAFDKEYEMLDAAFWDARPTAAAIEFICGSSDPDPKMILEARIWVEAWKVWCKQPPLELASSSSLHRPHIGLCRVKHQPPEGHLREMQNKSWYKSCPPLLFGDMLCCPLILSFEDKCLMAQARR